MGTVMVGTIMVGTVMVGTVMMGRVKMGIVMVGRVMMYQSLTQWEQYNMCYSTDLSHSGNNITCVIALTSHTVGTI